MSICRVAGVKVNMLTGDSQKTAESVAMMTGILQQENIQTASITGNDFSNLSIKEQYRLLSQPCKLLKKKR
jgi:magnesium-transporting ATPase (P-type)